eukprot:318965_1
MSAACRTVRDRLSTQNHKINTSVNLVNHSTHIGQRHQFCDQNQPNKMYSFGFKFKYGFEEESNNTNSIEVHPKYDSLKEELLQNNICVLVIDQFNSEYKKAENHYNSQHRKSNISWTAMTIEHLFCLMIYCNYSVLQFEFSKTYRIENGLLHTNYYWMGMLLKIAVHIFGTKICDGNIHRFYHGTAERLLFPQYIGDYQNGVVINCPLSTSASLEIAANFTNDARGLIIEFGGQYIIHEQCVRSIGNAKYFPVAWLSDFSHENEYLFIQTEFPLQVNNIVDIKFNTEYRAILTALKYLDAMSSANNFVGDVTDSMCALTQRIISNQLRNKNVNSKSFYLLTTHAQHICARYFRNKKIIDIDIDNSNRDKIHLFLLNTLFYSDIQWINLTRVHILFANIQTIDLQEINLTSAVIENILSFFQNTNTKTSIKTISVGTRNNSKLSAQNVIHKYSSAFRKGKMFISGWDDYLQISVCSKLEFLFHMLNDEIGECYFEDIGNEIAILMHTLMKQHFAQSKISLSKQDNDLNLFDEFCFHKKELLISCWNHSVLTNLDLFNIFYCREYEGVNMDVVFSLFPNMETLYLAEINLCSQMFENMLYLIQRGTINFCDREIGIWYPCENSELTISAVVAQYKNQFNKVGVCVAETSSCYLSVHSLNDCWRHCCNGSDMKQLRNV